jgi:uncharacterized protein YjbI with pentapeptide repeats
MADSELVKLLEAGSEGWNSWRQENPEIRPDLSEVRLHGSYPGAVLSNAYLFGTNFMRAVLEGASFRGSDLRDASLAAAHANSASFDGANLGNANLRGAFLEGATFRGAELNESNLTFARLPRADLKEARLINAILVETDLSSADLTGCSIYGISAWQPKLDGARQANLVITKADEPRVTVDNVEVAQLIYMLLKNEKLRHDIETGEFVKKYYKEIGLG